MEDHGPNQKKRHNYFNKAVDETRHTSSGADADHGQKKLKINSDALLDQPILATPLPNLLLSAFKENPAGGVKFQLFVSRSFSPPTSTSPPLVYMLKVTSASNSSGEVEPAGNRVDGGAMPVLTETRLVAEGQFLLRSRL